MIKSEEKPVSISENNFKFDKFDLMITIQRFFGLTYFGYYESEKKWKLIFYFLNQLIIYSIILNFCSPCLINQFNCTPSNRQKNWLGFSQAIAYIIVRNSISILSSIIYSLKGKVFRGIIHDLRKLFIELSNRRNHIQISKPWNLSIIFIYCVILICITTHVITFHKGSVLDFFKIIMISISESFLQVLNFSTDFYIIYLITYLVLIQKLFIIKLRKYQSVLLTEKDIKAIKAKYNAIQSMIETISNLLSPMLFFVWGAIFNDLLTSLYFTMDSIQKSNYALKRNIASFSGVIAFSIRLITIYFSAEKTVIKVWVMDQVWQILKYKSKLKVNLFLILRIMRYLQKWIICVLLLTEKQS